MTARSRIFIVVHDPDTLTIATELLETFGFDVTCVTDSVAGIERLRRDRFDVVLADVPAGALDTESGRRALVELREAAAQRPFGVISGVPVAPPVVARHQLAFALTRPCDSADLLDAIARGLALPPVSASHQQLLRSYFACLERSDWERLAELCAPEVVYHLADGVEDGAQLIRGRAALRRVAARTFDAFVEPRFAITAIRPLPTGALVRYDSSWLGRGGQRQSFAGAVLFRVEDDAIAEIGVRLDVAALSRAVAAPG